MKTLLKPMRKVGGWQTAENDPVLQRLQPKGIPILFEDEGLEMGESIIHSLTCIILFNGLQLHFGRRKNVHVFTNLNLYYSAKDPTLYVSPDAMIVQSTRQFLDDMASYRIGKDGPKPRTVVEVLSFRTFQEGDLTSKPILYSKIGVEEYILINVRGTMLPKKLLLLRRTKNTWSEEQDPDAGITSRLGFRLIVDGDKHLRVVNAETNMGYPRAQEEGLRLQDTETALKDAEAALKDKDTALQKQVARAKLLEAEVKRLRKAIDRKKK